MSVSPIVQRTWAAPDLEVRRGAEGDGRTVCGICVPFDRGTSVVDRVAYTEVFKRGAFTKTLTERGERVKFLSWHDTRSMPLGRATLLREDASGLYGEFRVSKTNLGDEVLELVRDGALDALSIGFRPIRPGVDYRIKDGELIERTEVALHEVSLVAFPAYEEAAVLAVRDLEAPPEVGTPRLDSWRHRFTAL